MYSACDIFVLMFEEEHQHLLSSFSKSVSDVQGKKEGERKEEVTKARGRKREQTDEDRTKKTSAERHRGRRS